MLHCNILFPVQVFVCLECSFSGSDSAHFPKSCTATFECCIATFGFLHCNFCPSCSLFSRVATFPCCFCNFYMCFATLHAFCNIRIAMLQCNICSFHCNIFFLAVQHLSWVPGMLQCNIFVWNLAVRHFCLECYSATSLFVSVHAWIARHTVKTANFDGMT